MLLSSHRDSKAGTCHLLVSQWETQVNLKQELARKVKNVAKKQKSDSAGSKMQIEYKPLTVEILMRLLLGSL